MSQSISLTDIKLGKGDVIYSNLHYRAPSQAVKAWLKIKVRYANPAIPPTVLKTNFTQTDTFKIASVTIVAKAKVKAITFVVQNKDNVSEVFVDYTYMHYQDAAAVSGQGTSAKLIPLPAAAK